VYLTFEIIENMTISLYISPKTILRPIIITDTIVTNAIGEPSSHIATRHRDLPNGAHNFQNKLARKNVILDKVAALAFAGDASMIRDYLEYAPLALGKIEDHRPLKELSNRASQYKSGSINLISAMMIPGENKMHKIKPDYETEIEIDEIGYVCAIGSGKKYFTELIIRRSKYYQNLSNPDFLNAMDLAINICCESLIDEIYRFDRIDATFGSILEYIFYNPTEQTWERQPSTAYFIYQYNRNGDRIPKLIDRMFFYEPGVNNGWLLAIRSSADVYYNAVYKIPSVNEKNDSVDCYGWDNWRPKRIVLSAVFGDEIGFEFEMKASMITYYDVDDFNGVTKDQGRSGIRMLPFGDQLEEFMLAASKFGSRL
jgi:hypothetical protein